jgi:hypothetical protein
MVFTDNITGYPFLIVPNIVHYILFTIHKIEFGHFISILSVLRNQKPDKIMIHCDCDVLSGDNWLRILEISQKTKTKIIVNKIEKPTQIYGKPLNKDWLDWHASDIARYNALKEFGGIYIDRDVYIVKSMDIFRKFEMTINWDEDQYIGSQVLVAHRNARFLKLFLDSYHEYDSSQWYYNAGNLPTTKILYKNPELIHRVKGEFGVDGGTVCRKIHAFYYPDWQKEFYAIHFLIRGDKIVFTGWCFDGLVTEKPLIIMFNETIARSLNTTFGEMTRILFEEFKIT